MAERTKPEWLQGPGSGPSEDERKVPTFDLMVETLRDLCGRDVHLSSPGLDSANSRLTSRGELTEESAHFGVLFTAGGGNLFLREEDFQGGERHMAEYGHYFWVTIRTESGIFRLQDTDSI
jgi:hypothetical protein